MRRYITRHTLKKTLPAVVAVAIIGSLLILSEYKHTILRMFSDEPAVVGALVSIGHDSIMVKTQSGEEYTFVVSARTTIQWHTPNPEIGPMGNPLIVGQTLSVDADAKNTSFARLIEIVR